MTQNSGANEPTPVTDTFDDRTDVWLPLLQRLSSIEQEWLVLKHPDSAFIGGGDIDSVSPRSTWPRIEEEFLNWAREQRLGTVVACLHAPGWLHLVALDPRGGHFYELDVNERKLFLGSTLYRAEDMQRLAIVDSRGFRKVRPGAEGLFKLIHNGTRRGGLRNIAGLRAKNVIELLAMDPEGAELAAECFGFAQRAILRAARATRRGRWDQPALLFTELRFLIRALTEPRGIAWRLRFRLERRRCPLLKAVFSGRVPPTDVGHWLDQLQRGHRIWDPEPR